MTLSAYRTAILPKVHGSWKLHTLFPTVDFFVMLSSLSGIVGQASQCNYGAGNTYQDALARHRMAQNLHGASIDIGAVKSVGVTSPSARKPSRGWLNPTTARSRTTTCLKPLNAPLSRPRLRVKCCLDYIPSPPP